MSNKNEAMNLDFFIRWYKEGKWKTVNVQDLTEEEFRQWICHGIGLIGMKKEPSVLLDISQEKQNGDSK